MIKRKSSRTKKPAPKRARALTNINNNLFAFHKARMLPHGRNVNVSCGMWKEEGGMRIHKGNLSPLSSFLSPLYLITTFLPFTMYRPCCGFCTRRPLRS